MKKNGFKNYFAIFILAVLIIAVYKTFDNIGVLFDAVKSFFEIITPFVVGFGIAFLLYPLCIMMERTFQKSKFNFVRKRRRGFSVLVVFTVFFLIIGAVLWFIIPALGKSFTNLKNFFTTDMPGNVRIAVAKLNEMGLYIGEPHTPEYWLELLSAENFVKTFSLIHFDDIGKYAGKIVSASSSVFDGVMSIIIAIYILIDRESLKHAAKVIFKNTLSQKAIGRIRVYVDMAVEFMYRYIFCVLLDALIVAVLSAIVLSIIGAKYGVLLGLMIGILNIIPYFGAIIGTIVAAIVTIFTNDFTTAVILAVSMIVLQQIDSNVIQPRLIDNSFSIKPFWVIFGVLVGGGFFGILGIILAIPVMALAKEIIKDYFEWKNAREKEELTETTGE